MADGKLYALKLTECQLSSVRKLFDQNEWELEIETVDRYLEKAEVAGDYVALNTFNGRTSPTECQRSSSPKRRIQSEPAILPSGVSLSGDPGGLVTMRSIGSTYKKSLKGTFKSGTVLRGTKVSHRDEGKQQWRVSMFAPGDAETGSEFGMSDIMFDHFLVADQTTLKVITRLSTEHVHTVSRVPVRIVLLIDKSGSMLHKIGHDSRHTKVTKVKHFAKQLIENLDDGDEAALVTFGEDAEIFFPLQKLSDKTRPLIQERLNKLDKGTMSRKTNLSAGLRTALKVFYDASSSEADYLESKNSILVFTDGEFNAGTTDTNSLIHEVRQNIRQLVPKLDESQNQWVTISVVATGCAISETAYVLSKTCSSDAYYYINKDAVDPEAELFLPVLLRKSAVAWNISYGIEAFQDIKFDDQKCSKDNRIRLRRTTSGKGPHSEKAYFMYDFAASHSRQIGIVAHWQGEQSIAHLQNEEVLFKLRVEFTNIKGERLWQEQHITKEDVLDALRNQAIEATTAACKHEMQLLTNNVLASAAEHVKVGNKSQSRAVMENGQRNLQSLLNEYGEKSRDVTRDPTKQVISRYAKSVTDNLGALISAIEESTESESWNRMKAVSTAIVRESPNVSDTVVDGEFLCPLPDINHSDVSVMKDPFDHLVARGKNKKRTTINLEQLLEDNFAM